MAATAVLGVCGAGVMAEARGSERQVNAGIIDIPISPSGRVAIGRLIEAQAGERRGRPSGERPQDFAKFPRGKKTRQVAGKRAGCGNAETYRRANAVMDKGMPDLVAAMDAGASGRALLPTLGLIFRAPAGRSEQSQTIATKIKQNPRVANTLLYTNELTARVDVCMFSVARHYVVQK